MGIDLQTEHPHHAPHLAEPAPSAFLASRPYYPWLIVATTCVAAFAGQVDASIVQLALPTLERAFDARLSAVSWVAIAYVLAFAAALPVFARLAEMAGRKLMYLIGFTAFGVASAACGFAPSLGWLIAFRVVQGISGAMLGANSVVILVAGAGPARRGRAMGWFSSAQAIGVSLGPAAGGFLLGTLNWHWLFWVSVPFSLLGGAMGWFTVPKTASVNAHERFDAPGALLLIPGLTALLMAVSLLHAWGPASPRILACVAAAVGLLSLFVWRERRAPSPLLDMQLFAAPAFSVGGIGVILSYGLLYGMFFAMSFALVRGYHDTPVAAGARLTIVPVTLGLVAPFSGALYEKQGRATMIFGMALCAGAALGLRPLLNGAPGSLLYVMPLLAVFGAGLGLFIAPNNTATLDAAPAARSGQAGGLLNLMRAFGTGCGVAAAATLLGWNLADHTGSASPAMLLTAIGDVLLMLAGFAALAGLTALVKQK